MMLTDDDLHSLLHVGFQLCIESISPLKLDFNTHLAIFQLIVFASRCRYFYNDKLHWVAWATSQPPLSCILAGNI